VCVDACALKKKRERERVNMNYWCDEEEREREREIFEKNFGSFWCSQFFFSKRERGREEEERGREFRFYEFFRGKLLIS